MISEHPESKLVIKILDIKRYMLIKVYFVYISRDFNASLAIEMYGPFLHREYYYTL